MVKEFETEGYWWKPESPENRIAGILHYKPNFETDLRLFGDLV
ncbi:ApeA N-terminal domain 1-containing protein [Chryseobacterium cucumeris]